MDGDSDADGGADARAFERAFAAAYLVFHRRDRAREELSGASRAVLLHLSLSGPLSVGAAATHLGRAQSVVSEIVSQLQRHGWVERPPCSACMPTSARPSSRACRPSSTPPHPHPERTSHDDLRKLLDAYRERSVLPALR